MSPGYLGSGSNIAQKQYVLLRTIQPKTYSREDFLALRPSIGLDMEWGLATALVEQATDFQKYMKVVRECTWVGTLLRGDPDWPDGFRAIRERQEQVIMVGGCSTMQDSIYIDRPPKRQSIYRRVHDSVRWKSRKIPQGEDGSTGSPKSEQSRESSEPASVYRDEGEDEHLRDTDDEATVQAVLLLLLQEVTSLVPGRTVQWTFDHLNFKAIFAKTEFTARTDGGLRAICGNDILTIIETKARMRIKKSSTIYMQEAAEMALWILREESCVLDLNGRRILFSQDRHQVWLTLARYTTSYREYLINGTIGPNSFLYMSTYGPWNILIREHMLELAIIVVSIILKTLPQQ
ncbi:hypothetical protein BJX76DRAFT_358826 [Aspergillus varians]